MIKKFTPLIAVFTFLVTMMLVVTPFSTAYADENDDWLQPYHGRYLPVDRNGNFDWDYDEARILRKGDSVYIGVYPYSYDGRYGTFEKYMSIEEFKEIVSSGGSISFDREAEGTKTYNITVWNINGESITYKITLIDDIAYFKEGSSYPSYARTLYWFNSCKS